MSRLPGPFRPSSGPGRPVRRTARVLLLDAEDRLLLLRTASRGGPASWLTPGGGVRRREALPDAAARELREETGLRVAPAALGTPVARTQGHLAGEWLTGWVEDVFFLHRVVSHVVDTTAMEPHEQVIVTEHRWWTVPELAATTERVVPFGLVPLLIDLTAGHLPATPVELPWHH